MQYIVSNVPRVVHEERLLLKSLLQQKVKEAKTSLKEAALVWRRQVFLSCHNGANRKLLVFE
jgi:hypothetical protein